MFNRKFSSNIRRKKRMIISTIILLVVFLSAGYAAFTTNLGINGTLNVNKYVPKIYWALQDNDNDSVNETLVLSSEKVTGVDQGNFVSSVSFSSASQVPWVATSSYATTNNKSYNVTTVNVEKEIIPTSTSYWFQGVGYNAPTFIVNLEKLNTSQIKNMTSMFAYAGHSATTWDIGDLSNWNTSKVKYVGHMFEESGYNATTFDIGNLNEWDTSNVTEMIYMFKSAGYNATTWNIGDLSGWNTSQVVSMQWTFFNAGYHSTTWDIGNLDNWDTSNVTNMERLFQSGSSATIWNIGDLSGWNTSKVTNMSNMFRNAGCNASTFNLNFSGWNTSKVTNMSDMFYYSGLINATTFSVIIPRTNGNGINNDTTHMYGSTSSTYASPPSSRTFTVASS